MAEISADQAHKQVFVGKHADFTDKILKSFFTVYNQLGYGFLEKVYENALVIELCKQGLFVEQQRRVEVYYDSQVVGEYFSDILVNGVIILDLKSCRQLLEEHDAQLVNYLKASKLEVGLLLNFGPKPEYRRKVYDNDRKRSHLIPDK